MINVDNTNRHNKSMSEEMSGFNRARTQTGGISTMNDPFMNFLNSMQNQSNDPFSNLATTGQGWTGGDQPFTFPGQELFDQLGDQLSEWMTNGMVSEPGAWNEALGYLRPFATSGRPVDVSGLYDAMTPVANRYLDEQAKDLAESFGVGGLRWSTPLQSGITRETERMAENMGLAQTQAEITAQENAMNRALQAIGQMGTIGGMQGNFGLGQAGLQQNAANALFNLANTQAMMPLTIGQGMMGLQGAMEGMQYNALNGMQTNPYLSMALQLAGMNPSTYAPSGPTGLEQLLNIGMDWLPYFLNRGGGSNTGYNMPNFNINPYMTNNPYSGGFNLSPYS